MPPLLRIGFPLLLLPFAFVSIALSVGIGDWRGLVFVWIVPTLLVVTSAAIGSSVVTAVVTLPLGWYAPVVGWVGLPDDTINLFPFLIPVILAAVALVVGLTKEMAHVWRGTASVIP